MKKIKEKNNEKKARKKKKTKRKTPHNYKSPTYRQRFIPTIKNVTEEKKFKNLIRFHSANKIGNYNRGGRKKKRRKKERERIQKNLQNKSKHKNKKYFS